MEFEPITFSNEFIAKYWDGPSNLIARWYTYLQRGLSVANDAKYYALLVLGGFLKTDLHLPVVIWVICSMLGLVGLALLGRWHLFKAAKSIEFITARHGSITGFNLYNMTVKMVSLQESILQELKKRNGSSKKKS